jgi:hypothetical protein
VDEIDFHNIEDKSETLQVNEIEVTKINDMSQTLQMDEIDNVEVIYHSNETLNEDEVDDIDEIHHVNENKDMGMELTKSLKMIKYIILKVLYTNEK